MKAFYLLSQYLKFHFVEQYFTKCMLHRGLTLAIQDTLEKKSIHGQVPYPLSSSWSTVSTLPYLRFRES